MTILAYQVSIVENIKPPNQLLADTIIEKLQNHYASKDMSLMVPAGSQQQLWRADVFQLQAQGNHHTRMDMPAFSSRYHP